MEIRGVWITTTDSTVLDSRDNIAYAMKFLADTGFNVVFPAVWNNGSTNYRSQVMKEKFGIEIKDRFIDKVNSKIRDPLQELIEEAKKVDIAVIPWFEYGFMSSFKGDGGKILKDKPLWAARGFDGQFLVVNDYYWLNALDTEVQDFLLSLFLEVVNKYGDGIVGIQGDDHFPAFPMEGGYDEKTIKRYQNEFNQQPPKPPKRRSSKDPQEPLDPLWQDLQWRQQWQQWVRWRADILSNFLNRFYRAVINVNPELIISMSPSNYPWGYDNYLQDSQTWIDLGLVDLIHPQLYRKEFAVYDSAIDTLKNKQFTQQQLPQLIPGIFLQKTPEKVAEPTTEPIPEPGKDEIDKEHFVVAAIKSNRNAGIQGEVLFFYEDLQKKDKNNDTLANILKSSVYSQTPGKFDPKEIKKNTFTHRRINNYTYINTSQENLLNLDFDWVEPFSEGMAVVKMGYKYGYIDTTGKLVGRLEYDTAAPFSGGVALVKINKKDAYIGYIGYVDKAGKKIANLTSKFDDIVSFSEGIAAFKIAKTNQWGYINNPQGTIIIPSRFDDAKPFSEGLAAVKIGNKWKYIDKTGQTIIPSKLDDLGFDDAGRFSKGLAAVKFVDKWGYIDKTGKLIIDPAFDDADIFSEGLAPAKLDKKWGYINQFGEFVIPPDFDLAKPFSEGMALVNSGGEFKQNQEDGQAYFSAGKWGYIRKP